MSKADRQALAKQWRTVATVPGALQAPRRRHLHYAGERLTAATSGPERERGEGGRRTRVGLTPKPGTQAWAPGDRPNTTDWVSQCKAHRH